MKYWCHTILATALVASLAVPAFADWAVMSADTSVKVAKGTMSVKPANDWNRSSARPSKRSEAWTRDGVNLNELTFYGGINDGETFFRSWWSGGERVPRFKKDMLPTDIAELFEASNRQVLQTPVFQMGKIEPAKLGSHDGVRFGYTYAAQNEDIERRGEATAAIVEGRLYLVNFIAPSLHYFDASIGEVRQMIEGVEIIPPKVKADDGKKKKKKKKSSVVDIMEFEEKK